MKLTFLGTGTSTGVPVIGCDCEVCQSTDPKDCRLRSSALIETSDGTTILIDAGPDFRQQILRQGAKRIDAILLTHEHYDHVGGLDDVRGLNYSMRTDAEIYAQDRVLKAIRHNLYYAFSQKRYPGAPSISLHSIFEQPFKAAGVKVCPLPVLHDKLPIIGFRIGKLAYVTDASIVPHDTIFAMSGVDVLVINALGPNTHHSHMNLEQAIRVAREVGARQTFFTHISHKMGLYAWRTPSLPPNMSLAYDGLTVNVAEERENG